MQKSENNLAWDEIRYLAYGVTALSVIKAGLEFADGIVGMPAFGAVMGLMFSSYLLGRKHAYMQFHAVSAAPDISDKLSHASIAARKNDLIIQKLQEQGIVIVPVVPEIVDLQKREDMGIPVENIIPGFSRNGDDISKVFALWDIDSKSFLQSNNSRGRIYLDLNTHDFDVFRDDQGYTVKFGHHAKLDTILNDEALQSLRKEIDKVKREIFDPVVRTGIFPNLWFRSAPR